MGDNLLNLGNQINVPLHVDEDGYFGRECPVKECLGYFKVTLGTGIKGPASYHCPYCGHSGEHETFYTQEQIDYAITKGLRSFVSSTGGIAKDSGKSGKAFEHQPSQPAPESGSTTPTPNLCR